MELSDDERIEIVAWAEANRGRNAAARTFWALVEAKVGIDAAMESEEAEWKAISAAAKAKGQDQESAMTDEFASCGDAIEALEDAWFHARDILGHRCLVVMRAVG